jgi:hypothetical protein
MKQSLRRILLGGRKNNIPERKNNIPEHDSSDTKVDVSYTSTEGTKHEVVAKRLSGKHKGLSGGEGPLKEGILFQVGEGNPHPDTLEARQAAARQKEEEARQAAARQKEEEARQAWREETIKNSLNEFKNPDNTIELTITAEPNFSAQRTQIAFFATTAPLDSKSKEATVLASAKILSDTGEVLTKEQVEERKKADLEEKERSKKAKAAAEVAKAERVRQEAEAKAAEVAKAERVRQEAEAKAAAVAKAERVRKEAEERALAEAAEAAAEAERARLAKEAEAEEAERARLAKEAEAEATERVKREEEEKAKEAERVRQEAEAKAAAAEATERASILEAEEKAKQTIPLYTGDTPKDDEDEDEDKKRERYKNNLFSAILDNIDDIDENLKNEIIAELWDDFTSNQDYIHVDTNNAPGSTQHNSNPPTRVPLTPEKYTTKLTPKTYYGVGIQTKLVQEENQNSFLQINQFYDDSGFKSALKSEVPPIETSDKNIRITEIYCELDGKEDFYTINKIVKYYNSDEVTFNLKLCDIFRHPEKKELKLKFSTSEDTNLDQELTIEKSIFRKDENNKDENNDAYKNIKTVIKQQTATKNQNQTIPTEAPSAPENMGRPVDKAPSLVG